LLSFPPRRSSDLSLGNAGARALSPAAPLSAALRPRHRRAAVALCAVFAHRAAQPEGKPAAPERRAAGAVAEEGAEPPGCLAGSPAEGSALRTDADRPAEPGSGALPAGPGHRMGAAEVGALLGAVRRDRKSTRLN